MTLYFAFTVLAIAFLTQSIPISQASINRQCSIHSNYIIQTGIKHFTSCTYRNSNHSQEEIEITDLSQCQSLCCTASTNLNAIHKVEDCIIQDNKTSPSSNIQSIILFCTIVFLSFALAFAIFKGVYFCCSNRYKKPQNVIDKALENDITRSIYSILWRCSTTLQKDGAPCEQQRKIAFQTKKHDVCCRCKKDQVSIYALCGHSFHTECLYNWCQNHSKCPRCKNYKIELIKIYCTKCYCYYFMLQLEYYLKLGAVFMHCRYCITKEQFENKILKYYWIDSQSSMDSNLKEQYSDANDCQQSQ